jgi:sugar phosphate permease
MLWASLLSGTLVAYFDRHTYFNLRGWQMMLLLEGAPTLIWAGLWLILSDDRPADASWLSPDESAAVQARLDDEQRDVKHVKNYLAAFRDLQVLLLCALFFAWSVGIYGLNMWLPVIMKAGSNMGIARVGLFNAIPYLCGAVAMLVISAISDRLLIRKAFVWPCLLLGAVAFLGSYLVGPNHFWLSFTGLVIAGACMYAPYGPFWAMIPEMVSRNVIGESLALINTIGAMGGFLGTYGVGRLHKITGGYGVTFACLSVCLALAGLLTLAVRMRPRADIGSEVIQR